MSCTPEAELESHAHGIVKLPVILPPRRSHTLPSNPGRYGIDPAPVSEHDGEPLTFRELFEFWGVIWAFCFVAGFVCGALLGLLKGLM